MIKLFRKTRKKLLAEGKTKNYLKYAIGEIILVVIGILIALQINNLNQKNLLQKQEIRTLKSLRESVKINIIEFDTILISQILRNRGLGEVLLSTELTDKNLTYLDSLITSNVKNHTFDPSTGIYNSIISSGKIELISNDSLKNRISKLNDLVRDYQDSEDQITGFTRDHLETYFIDNYTINPNVLAVLRKRTPEEEVVDRAQYKRIFGDQKVKNMYLLLLSKMGDLIRKGQKLQAEYKGLVEQLDSELEEME